MKAIARTILLGVGLLTVASCATYQQQKADAVSGGPERRILEAQQRQQAAQDAQIGLQSDQEALAEEQSLQERQLAELDDQLQKQEKQVADARARNALTRAQEQALRQKIADIDRDLRDTELRMLSAQATGDTGSETQLQQQLRQLQAQADALDREIELLTQ
jgi:chromosome segregation ATPase